MNTPTEPVAVAFTVKNALKNKRVLYEMGRTVDDIMKDTHGGPVDYREVERWEQIPLSDLQTKFSPENYQRAHDVVQQGIALVYFLGSAKK